MLNFSIYETLNKPLLSPPAHVFSIAWAILYPLILLALFLYLKDGINREKKIITFIYIIQLALNLSWAPVFFGFNKMVLALFIVILMIFITTFLVINFWKYSRTSAILMFVYLTWIIFASYLNYGFIKLN